MSFSAVLELPVFLRLHSYFFAWFLPMFSYAFLQILV